MHAGPASNKFRAVMFFTAWPSGSAEAQYNPDTQYFAPLLCSDLASILWSALTVDDRVYLLTKLADTIKSSHCKNLFHHLKDRNMIDFTRGLAWGKYKRGKRGEYIATFATRQEELEGLGFVDDNGNPLEKVSVDGLVAEWEGDVQPVHVYKRADRAIVLYYPTDKTWEGTAPGKPYGLTMDESKFKRGRASFFDGTNGVLRDDEGEVIECYLSSKAFAAAKKKQKK